MAASLSSGPSAQDSAAVKLEWAKILYSGSVPAPPEPRVRVSVPGFTGFGPRFRPQSCFDPKAIECGERATRNT